MLPTKTNNKIQSLDKSQILKHGEFEAGSLKLFNNLHSHNYKKAKTAAGELKLQQNMGLHNQKPISTKSPTLFQAPKMAIDHLKQRLHIAENNAELKSRLQFIKRPSIFKTPQASQSSKTQNASLAATKKMGFFSYPTPKPKSIQNNVTNFEPPKPR